jgi:hypothetical protein
MPSAGVLVRFDRSKLLKLPVNLPGLRKLTQHYQPLSLMSTVLDRPLAFNRERPP